MILLGRNLAYKKDKALVFLSTLSAYMHGVELQTYEAMMLVSSFQVHRTEFWLLFFSKRNLV